MPQAHFQVFNADGSLQMDLGSRSFRLLTVANIGTTTSGSIPVDLSAGKAVTVDIISTGKIPPKRTKYADRVDWDYTGVATSDRDSNYKMMIALY